MALCSVVYICRVKQHSRVRHCDSDSLLNSYWRLRASIWNTFRCMELIRKPRFLKPIPSTKLCWFGICFFLFENQSFESKKQRRRRFRPIIWSHIRRDIITKTLLPPVWWIWRIHFNAHESSSHLSQPQSVFFIPFLQRADELGKKQFLVFPLHNLFETWIFPVLFQKLFECWSTRENRYEISDTVLFQQCDGLKSSLVMVLHFSCENVV